MVKLPNWILNVGSKIYELFLNAIERNLNLNELLAAMKTNCIAYFQIFVISKDYLLFRPYALYSYLFFSGRCIILCYYCRWLKFILILFLWGNSHKDIYNLVFPKERIIFNLMHRFKHHFQYLSRVYGQNVNSARKLCFFIPWRRIYGALFNWIYRYPQSEKKKYVKF